MDTHKKGLTEMLLISTHNICFHEEIKICHFEKQEAQEGNNHSPKEQLAVGIVKPV